uniref:ubiquitinyl hydrolase 1 n=1 Tax=Glossina brevipalpis TaxID=37001 RepID=A0A1A9WL62_9MUSC
MPVTSPRRSLILASGSIYGTSSSTTGGSRVTSTSATSSTTSERTSGYKSYLDRAGSLSKYSVSTSTSSSYSPTYSYLSGSSYSSYSPRSYLTYRSTGSSLTGGSSGIGTYRSTSSSLNNYDTNSCGVNKRSKGSEILRKDSIGQDVGAKKPPSGSEGSGSQSKRTPGSCSSSSLARLVATSALDIYEKYSPAHYKSNTELSGSRSSGLNEVAAIDSDDRRSTTSDVAYERPHSRYSRLYSQQQNVDEVDNIGTTHNRSGSGPHISGRLNISNSSEDVPKATVTLRGARLRKTKGNEEDRKVWKNGAIQDHENSSNGVDATLAYVKLNKLKLNSNQAETPEFAQTQGNNKLTDSGGSMYDANDYADTKWNNADSTKEDINENTKQKCDPVIVVRPQTNATKSALNIKPATVSSKVKQTIKTTKVAGTAANRGVTNTVREANQNFFLIATFKDQNFLKEECELAHAQVSKSTAKKSILPSVESRKTNTVISSLSNNNYRNSTKTSAALAALAINGMRRSSNGSQLGTATAITTSLGKVDNKCVGSQCKGFANGIATSTPATITGNSATTASSKKLSSSGYLVGNSTYGTTKLTKLTNRNSQVKPLIHRSGASATSGGGAPSLISQRRNNNNNGSNTSLNSASNNPGNNNMQTSLDQEDIKFIDSDEQPTTTAMERKSQVTCSYTCSHSIAAVKNRVRPKSTIISSASSSATAAATTAENISIFEKVNNYKYSNGTAGGAVTTSSPLVSGEKRSECRQPTSTVIDSNGIRASIEKFNHYSEQKRLPLNSVKLRSHGGGGSTNNLQHHRHSSDFDNSNIRLPNSGGGSLTRTPYRSSAGIAGKPTLYSNTAATTSTTRQVIGTSPNTTGSLPLKNSRLYNHSDEHSASGLSSSMDGDTGKKKLSAISGGEDSIRNTVHTTASSVPRYWERDSSRPSISTTRGHADERKLSFSNEDTEAGLCGLRNIGNTCFMNSVIQCLSHTNELTKFLRNYSATKSPISKDQQILYEFSKLIREMWSPNTHSVTPLELKRAFSSKHRMYSDYNQQDAQEFLRFFLDSLHCALNTGSKGEHLRIDDNLSDNRKAEQTWEWYCRHECSIIRDLFVGQLKSTLRCTVCGNASVTFDPFWDLSVPLPSSSRCKLEACLDLFIREEVLDGDEMPTCSKCQTRRKCTKSFTIQRFPRYLVIRKFFRANGFWLLFIDSVVGIVDLKRFSETRWSKLSNIVEFPTGERELNMGSYAANNNSNIYYSLYAISNHMGSTAGGHYVAICKHPITQKWHEFNDNLVSDTLSEHHLVSSSAYILFYERA